MKSLGGPGRTPRTVQRASRASCFLAVALLFAAKGARAADAPFAPPYLAPTGTPAAPGKAAVENSSGPHGAAESDIDSEHIFGFTQGSDIGHKGELEAEFEPVGALGKRFGTYFATSQTASLKYTMTDAFRVAPSFVFNTFDIRNVPGFDDRSGARAGGGLVEFRYKFLDRRENPFGLTLNVIPSFAATDELGGQRVEQWGGEIALYMDREFIHNRLYGALNVGYGLSGSRLNATGQWSRGSGIGIDAALSWQFLPGIMVGGEVNYAHEFDGLGLNRATGDALYLGPTFFAKLGERANLSGGWNFQVAGKAFDEPRNLNLTDFEHNRFFLRLAVLLN